MEGLGVGRIVHYVLFGFSFPGDPDQGNTGCVAAIVTRVLEADRGLVQLAVFRPGWTQIVGGGSRDDGGAYFSDEKKPDTWHWPERAGGLEDR